MKRLTSFLILLFVLFGSFAQSNYKSRIIEGIVVDENNQPLPCATVIIKGTTYGVTTGFDGKFCLIIPKNKNVIVEWSVICPSIIEVIKSTDKSLKFKTVKNICRRNGLYRRLSKSSEYAKMINEFYSSDEFKNNKECK